MSAWAWLLGAALAGAASATIGWPAWSGSRARRAQDLNTERYLAWRGRAERPVDTGLRRGERRRLLAAALLGLIGFFCLVGFLTYA